MREIKKIVDELMEESKYTCYVYNRQRDPDVDPKEYLMVFPKALEYEARYQQKLGVM